MACIGLKSSCGQNCYGSCRGDSVSLPFLASIGCSHCLTHSSFPPFQSQQVGQFFSHPITLTLLPPIFHLEDTCDYIELMGIIWDNLPISRTLTLSHLQSSKYLLPCKVTYSLGLNINARTSLGAIVMAAILSLSLQIYTYTE